jgi:hypothetical protein
MQRQRQIFRAVCTHDPNERNASNTHAKGENARVGTHARGEYDHGLTPMGVRKHAVAAANQARREGEGGWITYVAKGVCVCWNERASQIIMSAQLYNFLSSTLCSEINSNCIQKCAWMLQDLLRIYKTHGRGEGRC